MAQDSIAWTEGSVRSASTCRYETVLTGGQCAARGTDAHLQGWLCRSSRPHK
jgi:hypothetical protein